MLRNYIYSFCCEFSSDKSSRFLKSESQLNSIIFQLKIHSIEIEI